MAVWQWRNDSGGMTPLLELHAPANNAFPIVGVARPC